MSMDAQYGRKGIPGFHTGQSSDGRFVKVQRRQTKFESCARLKCYPAAERNATSSGARSDFLLIVLLGERMQMRQKGLLNAAQIAAFKRDHANGA